MSWLLALVLCMGAYAVEEQSAPDYCDLLVIGAGVAGAFSAARFRQFNPNATICIVERSDTVGGRLQSRPLYDGMDAEYLAEYGGMRYFTGVHTLVPAALKQLGLNTTDLPYVAKGGVAYVRGKLIPLSTLGSEIDKIYNLSPNEQGLAPNVLYNRTITKVLMELNMTYDELLSNPYMVNHTMFNVLRDAGMSQEAINAYTDTAGYEWVLGSNAAVVAQEDLQIEGWGLVQTFVRTGFQSLVKALIDIAMVNDPNPLTNLYLTKSVTKLNWTNDDSGSSFVTAVVTNVEPAPVGDPIPEPVSGEVITLTAEKAIITTNPLQLFAMADWPWDVQRLMFDVEQIETVKIFMRFKTEWWSDIVAGLGRSVTTLPMRQVWVYAPYVLMIYGDSNDARYWKPYLSPVARPTPTWLNVTDVPELALALYSQLSEMFTVPIETIQQSSTQVSFAYWERCTAFWRAGCNIEDNIMQSVQPMPEIPIYFASDIWSSKQGWVEGALERTEAVMAKFSIPSIKDEPLPTSKYAASLAQHAQNATRKEAHLIFEA